MKKTIILMITFIALLLFIISCSYDEPSVQGSSADNPIYIYSGETVNMTIHGNEYHTDNYLTSANLTDYVTTANFTAHSDNSSAHHARYTDAEVLAVIKRTVYIKVIANDTELTTDDLAYFTVPALLNGMNLVAVAGSVYTASSNGTPQFDIYNFTDSNDMLSTDITIDVSELTSYTANTTAVIDTDYDDVATGDQIRVDCDVSGNSTAGWDMILTFEVD